MVYNKRAWLFKKTPKTVQTKLISLLGKTSKQYMIRKYKFIHWTCLGVSPLENLFLWMLIS